MKKIFYLLFLKLIFNTLLLNAQTNCPNLVTNGDFETSGGFTSALTAGTGCVINTYNVNTNFNLKCSTFPSRTDHTSGTGKFLIIQSSTAVNVWSTTVTVTPNTPYNFSFWLANAVSYGVTLSMQVGTDVKQFTAIQATPTWTQYTLSGTTPAGVTSLPIAIKQVGSVDFFSYGIDDVVFQSCVGCTANFTTTNIDNCGNIQFNNSSTSSVPLTYFWNFADPLADFNNTSTLQNPTHKYLRCGTYRVCLTITGTGCNSTICKDVVVADNTPPVITCPANKTVNCLTDTIPSVTGTATATDNCQNVSLSRSDALVGVLCDGGRFLRTWTATDACGNKSSCVQTIFMIYNAPVITCPANVSITALPTACQAIVPNIKATVNDNCLTKTIRYTITGATTASGNDDASGTTFNAGVSTVTYTVTDACNRVSSCSFTVTVSCPAESCLACGGTSGTNLIPNGSFTTTGGFTTGLISGGCGPGTYGITTDFNAFCSAWTTFPAHSAPNFLALDGSATNSGATVLWQTPITLTANTDYSFSFYWALAFLDSRQNFAVSIDIVNANGSPILPLTDSKLGQINIANTVREWKNECLSWNSKSLSGSYYIAIRQLTSGDYRDWGIDDICFTKKPPVACNAEFTTTAIGSCGNFQFTNTSTPTGLTYSWDFRDPPSGINNTSSLPNPTHQFTTCGTYNVRLIISGTGCQDTVFHTVNYSETTPPVITCPANKTVNCLSDTIPSVTGTATATDNCGTVTLSRVDVITGVLCDGGNIRRTWTARDACGNTSSCSQTIVLNIIPPTIVCPSTKVVACGTNVTPSVTGTATATDNCGATPSISFTDVVSGNATCDGNIVRTWVAVGTCNRSSTCQQTILIRDTIAPIITNCPTNLTVNTNAGQCYYTFPTLPAITATDNCGATPSVSYTYINSLGIPLAFTTTTQFPKGINSLKITAKDACNNVSQACNFTLTVVDIEKPKITCPQNATVVGTITPPSTVCKAIVNGLTPTVTDNCQMTTVGFTISPTTNATPSSGTNDASGGSFTGTSAVTYTATDMAGNTSSCSFTVTVSCNVFCPGNILKNGDFTSGMSAGNLDGGGTASSWARYTLTPQVITTDGSTNSPNGCIQMWGNQSVGEGIKQAVSFQQGCTYKFDFNAKYLPINDATGAFAPTIRFRVNPASYISASTQIYTLPTTLTQNWASYSFNWTAPNSTPLTPLVITPWNNQTSNTEASKTSWVRIDDICITKVGCPNTDTCGRFSNLAFNYEKGPNIPATCGNTNPISLQCPNSAQRFNFSGQFSCSNANSTLINWTIWRNNGSGFVTTGITGSTSTVNSYFGISLLKSYLALGGVYELRFEGNCGNQVCPCSIRFEMLPCIDVCPCDPASLKGDVGSGFTQSISLINCKACFKPKSLRECDRVEWSVTPLDSAYTNPIGSTIGNNAFCFYFSKSGTYIVTMRVIRQGPNGTTCELTISKRVRLNCFNIVTDCDNTIVRNPKFSLGSVVGPLSTTGRSLDWQRVSGKPAIVDSSEIGGDRISLKLNGNYDNYDIVRTESPYCLDKDTGTVTLSARTPIHIVLDNQGLEIVVNFVRGDSVPTFPCTGDNCIEVARFQYPENETDWIEFNADYDLRNWNVTDSCSGSTVPKARIRPYVYVTNMLRNSQGGDATQSNVLIDNFCIKGKGTVPVNSPKMPTEVRLFPNPNHGSFTLELSEAATSNMSYRVTDLLGRVVLEKNIELGSLQQVVETNNLSNGLYFLQVLNEGKKIGEKKFVKQ